MDFANYLKDNAGQINEELDLILADFLNEVKKTNIKLLPFALGLLNSCKGGKRIRGVLVKLGYEIEKESSAISHQTSDILKIAAAIEILHTGFLIHDDIMDESLRRRGQPSLYSALGGNHYGISQAITVGDIALYLPIKLIIESDFLGEYKLKVLSHLSQIVINTGWGQIMDVESASAEASADKGIKDFINLYKTAKYTVAGPLQIGAILAGADEILVKLLGEFGENLGIAFQIKDDILDGEAKSPDEANAKVLEYTDKAGKIIPNLTDAPKMRILLNKLVDYMIERTK